jgi:hypothetical protein
MRPSIASGDCGFLLKYDKDHSSIVVQKEGERTMIRILLLLVFIIALAVPAFNRVTPVLFGFPFFYWYQILVVIVSSLLIYIVFRVEDKGAE